MPQRRISTILRFLFTLSLSLIAAPFTRMLKHNRALAEPFSQTTERLQPSAIFISAKQILDQNSELIIDTDFLKKFIVAKSFNHAQIIAQLILKLRQFEPAFKHYFDLVFSHMPHFKIEIVPLTEIRQYSGQEKTLAIFGQYQVIFIAEERMPTHYTFDQELAADLAHEMRHAAMNTMQLTLAKSTYAASTDCYYPPQNNTEKHRVIQLLELGKHRVNAMLITLQAELSGKINNQKLQTITTLRSQLTANADHQHYYKNGLYLKDIQLIKTLGEKIKIGDRHLNQAKKPMIIQDIMRDADSNRITAIKYIFEDPLYNLASLALSLEESVKNAYDDDKWLYELDAFFQTYLPQLFIQHFYSEFYHYTTQLLNQAQRFPFAMRTTQAVPLTQHDIQKIIALNPQLAKSTRNYFNVIDQIIAQSNIVVAKKSLKLWINRGTDIAQANLWLARIHHHEHAYRQAKYYYQRAERQEVPLDKTDRLRYADTLNKIGLFKTVKKKNPPLTINSTPEPPRQLEL